MPYTKKEQFKLHSCTFKFLYHDSIIFQFICERSLMTIVHCWIWTVKRIPQWKKKRLLKNEYEHEEKYIFKDSESDIDFCLLIMQTQLGLKIISIGRQKIMNELRLPSWRNLSAQQKKINIPTLRYCFVFIGLTPLEHEGTDHTQKWSRSL